MQHNLKLREYIIHKLESRIWLEFTTYTRLSLGIAIAFLLYITIITKIQWTIMSLVKPYTQKIIK
jgi:hypothetical protein